MLKIQSSLTTDEDMITKPTQEDFFRITLELENNNEVEINLNDLDDPEKLATKIVSDKKLTEASYKPLLRTLVKLKSTKKLIRTQTLSDCSGIEKDDSDLSNSARESLANQSKMIAESPKRANVRSSFGEQMKTPARTGSFNQNNSFKDDVSKLSLENVSQGKSKTVAFKKMSNFNVNEDKSQNSSNKTDKSKLSAKKMFSDSKISNKKNTSMSRKSDNTRLMSKKSTTKKPNHSLIHKVSPEEREWHQCKLFSGDLFKYKEKQTLKVLHNRSTSTGEVYNRLFWDAELKRKIPKMQVARSEEEEEEESKEQGVDPSKKLYEDAKFRCHRKFLAMKKKKETDDEEFSQNCTFTPSINRDYTPEPAVRYGKKQLLTENSETKPRTMSRKTKSILEETNYRSVASDYKPFLSKKQRNVESLAVNTYGDLFKPKINTNYPVNTTFSTRNLKKKNKEKQIVLSKKSVLTESIMIRIEQQINVYFARKQGRLQENGDFKEMSETKHTSKKSNDIMKNKRVEVYCKIFLKLVDNESQLSRTNVNLDKLSKKVAFLRGPIEAVLEEFSFEAAEFVDFMEIVFGVFF